MKEVFGLSEAINPESRNLGPNEVGKDAIDEISAYASKADKATPGTCAGKCRMKCSSSLLCATCEGFKLT